MTLSMHDKATKKEIRQFGLGVGGFCGLLGAALFYYGKPAGPWLLAAGILLALAGWFDWPGARPLYRFWMRLARLMSAVMTRLILIILYLLVLVPISLFARLVGQKFVAMGFEKEKTSYWESRPPGQEDSERCERQF